MMILWAKDNINGNSRQNSFAFLHKILNLLSKYIRIFFII